MSLSTIKNIIAIGSGKGGVGKSTVAANLAFALEARGFKVGLLDADIYGPSQTGLLGTTETPVGKDGLIVPLMKDGIKSISMGMMNKDGAPVIMRAPMAVKAITQFLTGVLWGDLDFLLLDLPPGTGDIQLSMAQQVQLSGVIIVTTPQKLAADIAKKGLQMFEMLNAPILGVVENMSGFVCGHCHEVTAPFKKGGGKNLAEMMKVPFLGEIPLDPGIMDSSDEGLNLREVDPESPAIKAFDKIVDDVIVQVERAKISLAKTTPEKIEHDDFTVRIIWRDGSSTEVDAYTLRTHCPCALCVDENSGKRILKDSDVPLSIKAHAVRPVGRYGIMVDFSDGHNKGIFKFSILRDLAHTSESKTVSL